MNHAPTHLAAILAASAAMLTIPATATAQETATPRANTEKLMLSLALGGASLY